MATTGPEPETNASLRESGRDPTRPIEPRVSLFVGPVGSPDEYELMGEGHRGGEGFVFRARYRGNLPRPVTFAIKQLVAPPFAVPGEWPQEDLVERWREQLKLLHLVRHEHLVGYRELFVGWPPHPRGTCVGTPPPELSTWYLIMEWVEGPSLHELVRAGRTGLAESVTSIAQLAEAVEYLHAGTDTAGMALLHRDIKPGNVIINTERGAVLVDCGLMRVEEPALTELPAWTGPYLSPEVHADKTRTSRSSDMWAVAATTFYALTGEQPSPFDTALMRRQLNDHVQANAPNRKGLVQIVMGVLEAAPDNRPSSPTRWANQLLREAGVTPQDVAAPVSTRHVQSGARRWRGPHRPVSRWSPTGRRPSLRTSIAFAFVLAAAGVGLGFGLTGSPGSLTPATSALPRLYANGCPGKHPATVEPHTISVCPASNDGPNTVIYLVTWSSWTASSAAGKGIVGGSCAGTPSGCPAVTITLGDPVESVTQGRVFAAMTYVTEYGLRYSVDTGPQGCTNSPDC